MYKHIFWRYRDENESHLYSFSNLCPNSQWKITNAWYLSAFFLYTQTYSCPWIEYEMRNDGVAICYVDGNGLWRLFISYWWWFIGWNLRISETKEQNMIFEYLHIYLYELYIYTYILKTLCYIYFYIVLLYNSSYKWSLFFYFKYFRATALDFVRVVNLKKLFYYICVFCSWISDTEIYKSVWKRFDTILWYYFILLSIV